MMIRMSFVVVIVELQFKGHLLLGEDMSESWNDKPEVVLHLYSLP